MSWNEKKEGPPNIDEALRQLRLKLKGLFGGYTPSTGKSYGVTLIATVVFAIYVLSGIYIVEPAEEAVITRFGRYVDTEGPGPHWIAPFIESKEILNVQQVKTSKHGGLMLTKDENIVSAEIAVQYRINNAKDYLFNVVNPEESLEQVSESALRSVVGKSTLNEVLTSGRNEIGAEIRSQIQQILDNYKTGIEISDLAMQQTKAPEEVKAAFDDAIKAQQDEERLVNESQAYARRIIPLAEGRAKRMFEESRAYKERVTLEAQGKTAKFAQVLPEYQRSPQVTRERLYVDTLQEVYTNTPKVLVDVSGSNNMMYLPLDKLIQQQQRPSSPMNEGQIKEEPTSSNPNQIMRPSYDDVERSQGGA